MVRKNAIKSLFSAAFMLVVAALLQHSGVLAAHGAERVALVIGNSSYKNTTPLRNPRNDAEAVADALSRMGFVVIKGIDVDQFNFRSQVRAFTRELQDAKLALFFYAGHGLQVHGKNFLVPTDAVLKEEADLDFEALDLQFVMQQMERGERTNIVLLDACRDNPLARNLSRTMGTRSAIVGRGLARVETGVGTFVGFATQPGNVALDGEFDNSPFTTAFLKHVERPGLDIGVLMRRVREDVIAMTDGKQVPWSNSSLVGDDVVLNRDTRQIAVEPKAGAGSQGGVAATPQGQSAGGTASSDDKYSAGAANTAIELAFWNSVKDSSNPVLIEAYLTQYPNGIFSDLARVMLQGMTTQQSEAVPKAADKKHSQDDQKLASVDGGYTQKPVQEEPERDPYTLSLDLQKELNRLGCSAGAADGIWGRQSRAALQRYARHSGVQLDGYEPAPGLLDRMRKHQTRVCPIMCGARYLLKSGQCVLKSCRSGQVLSKRGHCIAVEKPVVRKKHREPVRKKRRYENRQPSPQPQQPRKPWEDELENCPQCLTL